MDKVTKTHLEAMNRAAAANAWLAHGYSPMPVTPGQKATRYKHAPWLEKLTDRSVDVHWSMHPNDDIALHCRKGLVVLDADSQESLDAMLSLETKHGLHPKMVVNTKKGVHHYFRQTPELRIKSAGYSTDSHPERIDVRCGSAYIIAPPSTGKTLATEEVVRFEDLTLLTQEFVDELFVHNGEKPLTERPVRETVDDCGEFGEPVDVSVAVARMRAMLEHIDPDEGYSSWLQVLMAIHHETGGSDEGLELADEWSSKGGSYDGFGSIEEKWSGFNAGSSTPVTMGSIKAMLTNQGLDWAAVCAEADDPFEPCEMEIVRAEPSVKHVDNPLMKFSLLDKVDEIIKNSVEAKPMLGPIAMSGQVTALWAAPNTGKTLIVLNLVKEAITTGTVDPQKVFYANLDDGANGILTKSGMAQELRFHQIAFGFEGLSLDTFKKTIREAVASKTVKGSLLIIDTVKKVADVMNKTDSSELGALARQYTAVGGTVVLISHTNKNKDSDGKPVYSGTSDILQDVDCGWVLSAEKQDGETVVTFENIKSRGFGQGIVRFAYQDSAKDDYLKLVDSVRLLTVDDANDDFELVPQAQSDSKVVAEIKAQIAAGQNKKTALIQAVSKAIQVSQNKVMAVLDKFTNEDPITGEWRVERRLDQKNALIYSLHETAAEELELI